jgi:hypothetical protein
MWWAETSLKSEKRGLERRSNTHGWFLQSEWGTASEAVRVSPLPWLVLFAQTWQGAMYLLIGMCVHRAVLSLHSVHSGEGNMAPKAEMQPNKERTPNRIGAPVFALELFV